MIPMLICEVCGKKMPKHILVKHMAKSHTEMTDKPSPIFGNDNQPKEWDMGEINTCQQCHEVWPSRLMELHMHVRHGL